MVRERGYMIFEVLEGFKVRVYDQGWGNLCQLVGNKFEDCVYKTREDAEKALLQYIKIKCQR